MGVTVRELADLVRGKIVGDGELIIHAARPLSDAEPGDITFLENGKRYTTLEASKASAAVVPTDTLANGKVHIQVSDPLFAFAAIVRHLHKRPDPGPSGIDPRSAIHPTVIFGEEISVAPFVSIGEGTRIGKRCRFHSGVSIGRDCQIGDDVTLHPNVVVYDGVILGNRAIVHANSVVGADGFGYRFHEGRHQKVPQLGIVEVGDDVEIGACATIDRGTFAPTRIGTGTKIDNLVQIAHNCQIGAHNIIVAQVGIAGSSTTGNYVVLAGQSGVVDHVNLGDGVVVGAKSAVTKDVPAGERVLGIPALPVFEQRKVWVSLERLPEIRREVRRIKKHLGMSDTEK